MRLPHLNGEEESDYRERPPVQQVSSVSLSARVTWRSFQAGAWRMVLPGLASLPFGIGFGVAAAQKGLSAFETTLMSFTVMAGTSQMVALDIWAQPLPLVALFVSVFVANLRYFVMGAALQPHLPHLPWWQQPLVWYVTVDQNWAINIAEYRRGHGDLGKFLGGGFIMACIWSGSTLLGHLAAGGVLSDPTAARRLGLDFVGVAVFVVSVSIRKPSGIQVHRFHRFETSADLASSARGDSG